MHLGQFLHVQVIDHFRDQARVLADFQRLAGLNVNRVNRLGCVARDLTLDHDLCRNVILVRDRDDDKIIQLIPVQRIDDRNQFGCIKIIDLDLVHAKGRCFRCGKRLIGIRYPKQRTSQTKNSQTQEEFHRWSVTHCRLLSMYPSKIPFAEIILYRRKKLNRAKLC